MALGEWANKSVEYAMNINGVNSSSPLQKIVNQPVQRELPTEAPQVPVNDKLELSGMSHLLKALKSNDVRTDLVADVKGRIDAGTYEDDHKLDVAVDRLLDDLSK